MDNIFDYSQEYWDKGFSIIPIRKGDKKPNKQGSIGVYGIKDVDF